MKSFITLCFLLLLNCLVAQQKIQLLDKATDFPLGDVEIKTSDDLLLDTTDRNGFAQIPDSVGEIFIDHPGFPPQIFQLPVPNNRIYLVQDMVNLRTLEIKANDDRALDLVRNVIRNQDRNSPKSLNDYKLKSYTKFWADAVSDSIPYIENPKTKADSAQNKSRELLKESMFFISERAINHYYNKSFGEKNIVEAARISGIQTPMYELVALQPISVEFDQNEFDFFFRKFTNPISLAGIKVYNYFISDTVTRNERKQITLNFSSKKEEKQSIHGSILVDEQSFALSRFYAENQTKLGSDTYIEVAYKPESEVWIPDYQIFRVEANNMNYHVYEDSIAANGEVIQKKINKKSRSWVNSNTKFFGFTAPSGADDDVFKGIKNEVPKEAFRNFDEKIKEFRPEILNTRETTTYVKIDSIGKAEKVDRMVKIFRFVSQEGWIPFGPVDLDAKELFTTNEYEDYRLGLSLRTNHLLHERLRVNGQLYYGTTDKKFKYGVGADYLILPQHQGRVFADFTDDIIPLGRFKNPIYTLGEAFAWYAEQSANPYFVKETAVSAGYEQDIFKNVAAKLILSKADQNALFNYSFNGLDPDKEFGLTMAQLALRWAPNEESVASPLGKFRIKRDLPVFKLMLNQGLNLLEGEQEFTRINLSANYSWNIFSKPTLFNLRAGKVFGEAPIWQYFDGGGKSRDHEGFWQRLRFGGTQIFETMIPGEFISDRFIFGGIKQQILNLKITSKKSLPISGIYKIGIGDFEKTEIHSFNFNVMDQPYQEVGLEINNILFGVIGLGAYYRVGAYNFGEFDRDLSVKAVLNLNSF